jgi:hypothetical protein
VLRDDLALVADADLRRADRRRDAQAGEGDRDRVAVLTHRHQRIAVEGADARSVLSNAPASGSARNNGRSWASWSAIVAGLPWMRGTRSCSLASRSMTFSCATDSTAGTGNEVVAPEQRTSPSTPPFSCAPCSPDRHEQRAEAVVRTHRDEHVGLHAPAILEELLDRRAEIVMADLFEHPAEPRERLGRDHQGMPAASRPATPC